MLDVALVPDPGFSRDGPIARTFIQLWTIASVEWPGHQYHKSDWKRIDAGLFVQHRTSEVKQDLVDAFSRQWHQAMALPGYDPESWAFLARLIQDAP